MTMPAKEAAKVLREESARIEKHGYIMCSGPTAQTVKQAIDAAVAALSGVLNATSTPPADAALADDALCESLIEASDMRWNGDVYIGDGADLMNLVRAALRARAVPDEPPEWPEYHEHGMGCGIEDRGITDRYEACRYGFEEAVERCVEAFDNWLAASKAGDGGAG